MLLLGTWHDKPPTEVKDISLNIQTIIVIYYRIALDQGLTLHKYYILFMMFPQTMWWMSTIKLPSDISLIYQLKFHKMFCNIQKLIQCLFFVLFSNFIAYQLWLEVNSLSLYFINWNIFYSRFLLT